jgi:predicted RNA-binding Zn-ribbon protein involved in translation (DUF1610 family)
MFGEAPRECGLYVSGSILRRLILIRAPAMPDIVTLSCPFCGGNLQIAQDIDRFVCGYCGSEHIVRRGGGIVSLAPVVEGLRNVQTGVDKTAAELAIVRLSTEIDALEEELAELRKMPFNEMYPPSLPERLLTAGTIVAVSTFLGTITSDSAWVVGSGLVPVLVFLGAWLHVSYRRTSDGKAELGALASELEDRIADRERALEDARRLVEE